MTKAKDNNTRPSTPEQAGSIPIFTTPLRGGKTNLSDAFTPKKKTREIRKRKAEEEREGAAEAGQEEEEEESVTGYSYTTLTATQSSHPDSIINKALDPKRFKQMHEEETEVIISLCLVEKSFEAVLDFGIPDDPELAELINKTGTRIGERIKDMVEKLDRMGEECPEWCKWIRCEPNKDHVYPKEEFMYPDIKEYLSLHNIIMDELSQEEEEEFKRLKSARRFASYQKTNAKPEGSDYSGQLDIALYDNVGKQREVKGRPEYKDIFIVLEAKPKSDETLIRQADKQLYSYLLPIYQHQPNRRFLLGLTVCGREVRAHVFQPDHFFKSPPMDVSSDSGRKMLAKLLTSWALCPSKLLGYDPTMKYLDKHECWRIEVHDDATDNTKWFYFRKTLVAAERMLGRHTRCFAAMDQPTFDLIKDTNYTNDDWDSRCKYLIKDAWPSCDPNDDKDTRNEIAHLRDIKAKLEGREDTKGMYPELVVGGVVRLDGKEDTTYTAFAGIQKEWGRKVHYRVHRRLVTTPIAKPLRLIGSVKDLITVAADSLFVYAFIWVSCHIIHRDLSLGNIMFTRDSNGKVKGILIDYDCAVKISGELAAEEAERTGTYMFMSINNLLNSKVPRTVLDDCESLLYILCWLATIGINKDWRRDPKKIGKFPINEWRAGGDLISMARKKADHMASKESFEDNIVAYFISDPEYQPLRNLIRVLYSALFQYGDNVDYHGSRSKEATTAKVASDKSKPEERKGMGSVQDILNNRDTYRTQKEPLKREEVNPFELRAAIADEILVEFLGELVSESNKK